MRSSMHDNYGDNREPQPRRSTFNVSEAHKTSWNSSNLIPFYWDYIYPGEVRRSTTRIFIRFSNPLDYPLMDNAYVTVHWFSIPIRILWDNFRKFFGERKNPSDSIDYTIPEYGTGNANLAGSSNFQRLADHMGLPHVTSFDQADASALPFRAYDSIYNYWYRDSSIQNTVGNENTGDGPDLGVTEYTLRQRGKRFDYFTNVTPNPQRGESVTIGGEIATAASVGGNPGVYSDGSSAFTLLDANLANVDISGSSTNAETNKLYPNTTINELRNAVAIQQFLERDNRAGQLFGDLITAHYGATFLDAKYAPSFIAGGRAPFVFSPIPNQTQNTTSGDDIGDLGAIGMGTFEGASFTYRASEPEILMGIASCDADLTYHQGLNRKWSYRTRYDFVYPEFEGIGDQALLKKELYYQNSSVDDEVFGYSPRYEEARTGYNRLSREFRPDNATPLDTWHLAQDFTGAPALNSAFITSAPPFDRVVKNSTPDNFLADFHVEMYSTKALSARGIPGLARL